MAVDLGTAAIQLHSKTLAAIEEGSTWTEEHKLVCDTCSNFAHKETEEPFRFACYSCKIVTYNPRACFSPLQPLEIRPGRPLPDSKSLNWRAVSEVHLYVETLDYDLRKFLTDVINHHKIMVGKTPNAVQIARHMVS